MQLFDTIMGSTRRFMAPFLCTLQVGHADRQSGVRPVRLVGCFLRDWLTFQVDTLRSLLKRILDPVDAVGRVRRSSGFENDNP